MPKTFNSKIDKEIVGVVKKSNEKAQLPIIKLIPNANLIDYPNNSEDLNDIDDIVNSINEIGFTDPLEVTPKENDIYMILSGHRRRRAGVKTGMQTFPCLVKFFENDRDIFNYVLLANLHRDSSRDPLLIPKRYKMHEAYLEYSGFNGNMREEIAKRLGLSVTQADRHNYFNKIITPVWELVRNENVGMSSCLPMATLPVEDQNAVYQIFLKYLEKNSRISREKCEMIIQEYKDGKSAEDILLSATGEKNNAVNNDSAETGKDKPVQHEQISDTKEMQITAATEDSEVFDMTAGAEAADNLSGTPVELGEIETANVNKINQSIPRETLTKDERQRQRGLKIGKNLEKLSSSINKGYEFADKETAQVTLKSMSEFITLMFSEIQDMAEEYGMQEIFNELKTELKNLLG